MTKYHFDVLVIGSGLAGLYAALSAADKCKVAIVTKSTLEESNTYWAQGGIAAAISDDDSPDYHFNDTIKAGRGISDPVAVRILVDDGIARVHELIRMGMEFDKANDELTLGLEGGHCKRRVLHAGGDETGLRVADFLISKVKENKNIKIFEKTLVHKLPAGDESCYGAYAFDFIKNENIMLFSNATIIAAGGASGIYKRTTNPHTSTGDGISLAYNVGAKLANMEFVQFHPTAFYSETGTTFLISEAVRGEGAHLVNHAGERFMLNFHEEAELAPRDVVAKAIFNELKKTGKPKVFLKLDHLDTEYISRRFSHIQKEALQFGIDITKDFVPVAPAAHYMIGGVKAGYNAETNIKRLFVCGEAASTGVHGANRLASNSLLECLVFGKRAADSAINLEKVNVDSSQYFEERNFFIDSSKEELFTGLKNEIAELMTDYVGIVRDRFLLISAESKLEKISNQFTFTENEYYSIKLKSMITICRTIISAALIREESRGSHIRKDFPDEAEKFLVNIIQQKGKEPKLVNLQNEIGYGTKYKNCS